LGVVIGPDFGFLWAFLRGVSENVVVERVVFCGENVVDCVVNVENFRSLFGDEK
jgi:hypothetical protein